MDKKITSDDFYRNVFWLKNWFQMDAKGLVPFTSPSQETIFEELANGWNKTDIVALLQLCEKKYGREKVMEVIDLVIAENCKRDWAGIAQKEGTNGVDDLARLLLLPLQNLPEWSFTLENKNSGLQLHCTRCPHADIGKALGISEWVAHLVCGGDPHIVAGFNPKMGFRRSRMLTTGHDCCDHFYFMKS